MQLFRVLSFFLAIFLPFAVNAEVQYSENVFIPVPNEGGPDTEIWSCIIYESDTPDSYESLPPSPVVFLWTSYSLNPEGRPVGGCPPQFADLAEIMAQEGYIFVAANPRGVDVSGDQHDLSDNWGTRDGRDGANVVEWIADQSWSNTKVGVVGCSNSGQHALQLAVAAGNIPNSELDTVAPSCITLDVYRGAFYPGGLRNWAQWTNFARTGVDVTGDIILDQLSRGEYDWVNRAISNTESGSEQFLTTTDDQTPGTVWEDQSTRNTVDQINVPVFLSGTWHDFFRGAPEFSMRHYDASRGDRVTIYPGGHGGHLGIPGEYSGLQRTKEWFDFQLKGIPLPWADEEPIVYWENRQGFISGITGTQIEHRFYETEVWPPADVVYERWYLQPGRVGASPASLNDGGLAKTLPPASSPTNLGDAYPYPCAACPGQTNDPLGGVGTHSGWPAAVEDAGGAVVYTSEPMKQAMHIAGPIAVKLWATSTATDTDFVVKLLTQDPEGNFKHISNGWQKASHRAEDESKTIRNLSGETIRPYHPHTIESLEDIPPPGVGGPTPVEYAIEVWQSATEIPVGHRLKVWVSSSAAPWYIQEIPPATNTILHDAAHPSSVLLPIMPQSSIVRAGATEAGLYRGTTYYKETVEVNSVLQYTAPLDQVVNLPPGTQHYPLTIHYSEDMQPNSFRGALNFNQGFGWWFFNPEPGTSEVVNIPLRPGRNVVHLRGIVGNRDVHQSIPDESVVGDGVPDGNRDGSRVVKDIDIFQINVGP